jgi:hypothetical protein
MTVIAKRFGVSLGEGAALKDRRCDIRDATSRFLLASVVSAEPSAGPPELASTATGERDRSQVTTPGDRRYGSRL